EIHTLPDRVHRHQHAAEPAVVAAGEGDDVLADLLARRLVEAADDAEVEEAERSVVEHHEVAGVHVAVEEAVEDHRLEPAAQAVDQLVLGVDGARAHGVDIVDTHAVEALHRDHTARGQLVQDAWRAYVGVAELLHDAVELVHVGRLAPEVELLAQGAVEVVDDADRIGQLHRRDERDQLRPDTQDAHVGGDPPLDVWALNLDHDVAPVGQAGGVHLRDRGGGERRRIDRREDVLGARAHLDGERALDVAVGERLDAIEGLGEFAAVAVREQAVRGGDQLAELEVGRAEILEGEAHELGSDVALSAQLAQEAEGAVAEEDPGGGDEATEGGEGDGERSVAAHGGERDERDQQG